MITTMLEIILSIIGVVLVYTFGFKRGYEFREKEAISKLDAMMQRFEESQPEQIPIKVEKDNGIFFVYKVEDSSFLAQGKTKNDVVDILKERYPGTRFTVTPQNMREVGFEDE